MARAAATCFERLRQEAQIRSNAGAPSVTDAATSSMFNLFAIPYAVW